MSPDTPDMRSAPAQRSAEDIEDIEDIFDGPAVFAVPELTDRYLFPSLPDFLRPTADGPAAPQGATTGGEGTDAPL